MLAKNKAEERLRELYTMITYYDFMYFVRHSSLITDKEYDKLREELYSLEEIYPELITADSPSQRVGFPTENIKKKVEHKSKMLSLRKALDIKSIKDFFEKHISFGLVGEIKIDGVSICLEYNNGLLIRAATRGDGLIGEDVTNHMGALCDIPLKISDHRNLIIKGEIYITQQNAELVKNGSISKRNITAGILNKKNLGQSKFLNFFAYSVHENNDESLFSYHHESLSFLSEIGFKVSPHTKVLKNLNDLYNFLESIEKFKLTSQWDADGIVLKVDSNDIYRRLGTSQRYPLGAMAYKYSDLTFETKVIDIKWQLSQKGVLVPVVIIEPIEISNTKINRITLHNLQNLLKLTVGVGSIVTIKKSGDIIPKIVGVIEKRVAVIPNKCPQCQNSLSIIRHNLMCTNDQCKAMLIEILFFFTKRLKIKDLGKKTIENLWDQGLIRTPSDILLLPQKKCDLSSKITDKINACINNIKDSLEPILALPYNNINNKYVCMAIKELRDRQLFNTITKKTLETLFTDLNIPFKTSQNLKEILLKNKDEIKKILEIYSN